jgi:hypothetical protein
MDMSKLPRLSNTAENVPHSHDPNELPSTPIPSIPTSDPEPAMTQGQLLGAEVWLSAILGIVFMLMGKTFGLYLLAKLTGRAFHTGVNWVEGSLAGQEVPYPQLDGFVMLTDASLFLFGLALVFEAIVLVASVSSRGFRRPLVLLAFGVTVIAVAFNLFACGKLMSNGVTPLISLLATAFGVYIGMYEWALLKTARR